jgi:hypothetical protein
MYKLPIIISLSLILCAFVTALFIIDTTSLQLDDADVVTSLIAIFTCLGVLVSATFVVYSYALTNETYLKSQKPSLLIQVKSEHLQPNPQTQSTSPFTFIHYKNTSQNEFEDLTIYVKLYVGNRELDLSDLFRPKMFMAAHDQRHRRFETVPFILRRGIDINSETAAGNQVILSTSYFYTYNKKREDRKGPEYKWNAQIQHWELMEFGHNK